MRQRTICFHCCLCCLCGFLLVVSFLRIRSSTELFLLRLIAWFGELIDNFWFIKPSWLMAAHSFNSMELCGHEGAVRLQWCMRTIRLWARYLPSKSNKVRSWGVEDLLTGAGEMRAITIALGSIILMWQGRDERSMPPEASMLAKKPSYYRIQLYYHWKAFPSRCSIIWWLPFWLALIFLPRVIRRPKRQPQLVLEIMGMIGE